MFDLDKWTQHLIAIGVIAGYGVVQWFVLTHPIPPENVNLAMRSLGILDLAVGLILGFYFGASLKRSPAAPPADPGASQPPGA